MKPITSDFCADAVPARPNAAAPAALPNRARRPSLNPLTAAVSVLIVDDDPYVRDILSRWLTTAGYLTRQAGHSRVRLYANAKLPELVLYYAGLGYTEVERRRDRGFDRVFMAKTLDP